MKTLINPFEKFSEKQLLAVGLLCALAAGWLAAQFNARFDGVIDLHFAENVTVTQVFTDILLVVATLVLLLFALGKYLNKKTRLADILSTALIAKIPCYLLVFANGNNLIYDATGKLVSGLSKGGSPELKFTDLGVIIVFSVISLFFLVWTIILLFNGFRTAVNSKGIKHNLLLIAALLLAEIISKILIATLNS